MTEFTHYLLTRFDYPEDYPHLQRRLELFKRFTLRSVANQTNSNFKWIIKTKLPELKHLGEASKRIILADSFAVAAATPWIITSRLDNDDAIHPEYIGRVQGCFRGQTEAIDSLGYRLNHTTGEFVKFDYYNDTRCSPFVSLIEPATRAKTVLAYKHGHIGKHVPTRQMKSRLWCQVIHETNKLMRWKPGFKTTQQPGWLFNRNHT
jgi:hypothetical protein